MITGGLGQFWLPALRAPGFLMNGFSFCFYSPPPLFILPSLMSPFL